MSSTSVPRQTASTPCWRRRASTGAAPSRRSDARNLDGLAYAGCSAGVACLPEFAPDSDAEEIDEGVMRPGLGLVKGAWLMPHWDMLDVYVPGLTSFITSMVPQGTLLVTIDENTAMIG